MINHSTTTSVESQAVPGVRYELFVPNSSRRAATIIATALTRERLEGLTNYVTKQMAQPEGQRDLASIGRVIEAALACRTAVDTEYVRLGLKAVTGLLLDSKVPDIETFINCGPSVLVQECARAVKDLMQKDEQVPAELQQHAPALLN